MNPKVAQLLEGKRKIKLRRLQTITGKKILLFGDSEFPIDTAELIGEGTRREIEKTFRTMVKASRLHKT